MSDYCEVVGSESREKNATNFITRGATNFITRGEGVCRKKNGSLIERYVEENDELVVSIVPKDFFYR